MEGIRERIKQLLQCIYSQAYGKEHAIALSFLSAIAGEGMLLIGPPGSGKKMVARRLSLAFRNCSTFEYSLSEDSTPDDVFGPHIISHQEGGETYKRLTDGYLPTATVAYLNNIWNAKPSIQNLLFSMLDDKEFREGPIRIKTPLKGFIAATDRFSKTSIEQFPLCDRLLIWTSIDNVSGSDNFERMITAGWSDPNIPEELLISEEEYADWQKQISQIELDDIALAAITVRWADHPWYADFFHDEKDNDETPYHEPTYSYISDRKCIRAIKLLRTSAFLNGSPTVRLSDCFLLDFCTGNEYSVHDSIDRFPCLCKPLLEEEISVIKNEVKCYKSTSYHKDSELKLIDNFYYQIDTSATGQILIFAFDYYLLSDNYETTFYLHKSLYNDGRSILIEEDDTYSKRVKYSISKGKQSVIINGKEYPLIRVQNKQTKKKKYYIEEHFKNLRNTIDKIDKDFEKWVEEETEYCNRHLFLTREQRINCCIIDILFDTHRYTSQLNNLEKTYHLKQQPPTDTPIELPKQQDEPINQPNRLQEESDKPKQKASHTTSFASYRNFDSPKQEQ